MTTTPTPTHEADVVKQLAALAHPVRLQVFRSLVVAGADGVTPGVVADMLSLPASSLSFHLKELVNAGLVTQERMSRNLVYRVSFDRMNGLIAYLTENCCQGQGCLVDSANCSNC